MLAKNKTVAQNPARRNPGAEWVILGKGLELLDTLGAVAQI